MFVRVVFTCWFCLGCPPSRFCLTLVCVSYVCLCLGAFVVFCSCLCALVCLIVALVAMRLRCVFVLL